MPWQKPSPHRGAGREASEASMDVDGCPFGWTDEVPDVREMASRRGSGTMLRTTHPQVGEGEEEGMKHILLSLIVLVGLVSFPYFCWTIGRRINYRFSYRDMVRETVREMVKEDALRKR